MRIQLTPHFANVAQKQQRENLGKKSNKRQRAAVAEGQNTGRQG